MVHPYQTPIFYRTNGTHVGYVVNITRVAFTFQDLSLSTKLMVEQTWGEIPVYNYKLNKITHTQHPIVLLLTIHFKHDLSYQRVVSIRK